VVVDETEYGGLDVPDLDFAVPGQAGGAERVFHQRLQSGPANGFQSASILRCLAWQNPPLQTLPRGRFQEYAVASFVDRFYAAPDGLRLHYRDYPGAAAGVPVLCVPGLTRNCRDFEDLAPRLALSRRVLAVDLRGRGDSDRDPEWRHYQPLNYLADLKSLMAHAGVGRVVVVGTSLGGIMGTVLAAYAPGAVAGLVLNDIGPEFGPEGIARVNAYAGTIRPVRHWEDAAAQVRGVMVHAMPDLPDASWIRVARRMYRETPDGMLVPDMDPGIATALRAGVGSAEVSLWNLFDAVRWLPVAVLRGELSDLLLPETVERMKALKPDLITAVVPRRGHVPLLDEPESLAAIDAVLQAVDVASGA
jgi:pimeloyl-ACP methyl ester carboxylesterase